MSVVPTTVTVTKPTRPTVFIPMTKLVWLYGGDKGAALFNVEITSEGKEVWFTFKSDREGEDDAVIVETKFSPEEGWALVDALKFVLGSVK